MLEHLLGPPIITFTREWQVARKIAIRRKINGVCLNYRIDLVLIGANHEQLSRTALSSSIFIGFAT